MEFVEKRAAELYERNSGLSKPADQFGFGYPFLSYADIFHNYFAPDVLTTLVNSNEKDREKCSVRRGDVFLTRTSETTDELGMSCVALKDYPNATFNGFAKRLRPITDEIVPEYAAYYFRSSYFRAQCMSMASLITRASLNDEMISRLKIRYPKSKDAQAEIGKVLMNYDNLIEVNNKRIKVLEQMAENLYKEWYVRFRFPGHETAEFENGIPRGWNITRCKDIVPVLTGKKDANYGDDGGPYPFFTCAQEPIQAPDYSFDCAAVLLAGNCDLNAKVYKGKFEAYQRTYVLSPHNITHLFLLYYVIKDNVERLKQASTGAAISFITKGMIERIHFLLPPNELLVRFHGIMDDLYTQKDVLMKLNKNLIKQRDLLLPRLMSGKLEV